MLLASGKDILIYLNSFIERIRIEGYCFELLCAFWLRLWPEIKGSKVGIGLWRFLWEWLVVGCWIAPELAGLEKIEVHIFSWLGLLALHNFLIHLRRIAIDWWRAVITLEDWIKKTHCRFRSDIHAGRFCLRHLKFFLLLLLILSILLLVPLSWGAIIMILLVLIEGSFQFGCIFIPFLHVATDDLNMGTSTSIKN